MESKNNTVALKNPLSAMKRMIKQIMAFLFPAGKLEKSRRKTQYKDFFIFLATGMAFYFFENKIQSLISVQPADLRALQNQANVGPIGI